MRLGSRIQTNNIQNLAVTSRKLSTLNSVISSSCGSYTTTSTSYVAVTNLSITYVATSSRPICVALMPARGGAESYISMARTGGAWSVSHKLTRNINAGGETTVWTNLLNKTETTSGTDRFPVPSQTIIEADLNQVPGDSIVYKLYAISNSTPTVATVGLNEIRLIAYEM